MYEHTQHTTHNSHMLSRENFIMTTFNEVKNRKGMKERNKLQIIIKSEKKHREQGKNGKTRTHTYIHSHTTKRHKL